MTHPGADVSFSPDQALGVELYIVTTRDKSAFDIWVAWLDLDWIQSDLVLSKSEAPVWSADGCAALTMPTKGALRDPGIVRS